MTKDEVKKFYCELLCEAIDRTEEGRSFLPLFIKLFIENYEKEIRQRILDIFEPTKKDW